MAQFAFLVTKAGLQEMNGEHRKLCAARKRLAREFNGSGESWHPGEAEPGYLAFAEQMEFLNTRISQYEHILANTSIVSPPRTKEQRRVVQVGARIKIEVDGEIQVLHLVGTVEANPAQGKISAECPIGKALLGRAAGEGFTLENPLKTSFLVRKVTYPPMT